MKRGALETDQFDLVRFVEAQDGTYAAALTEIRCGAKRSHWMWFVFPQLAGLGSSATTVRYAIGSRAEASAYLSHPVLGFRYVECVSALQDLTHTTAERVFGAVDALKLRSSLTLFEQASGECLFRAALERWFGSPDQRTLDLLNGASAGTERPSI